MLIIIFVYVLKKVSQKLCVCEACCFLEEYVLCRIWELLASRRVCLSGRKKLWSFSESQNVFSKLLVSTWGCIGIVSCFRCVLRSQQIKWNAHMGSVSRWTKRFDKQTGTIHKAGMLSLLRKNQNCRVRNQNFISLLNPELSFRHNSPLIPAGVFAF